MRTALKLAGMALIFVCTTSIGMAMARSLERRVRELMTGISVVLGLSSELSYSLAPPSEAVARLEERESLSEAAYLPACTQLCRQGLPFPQAWRRAVEENRGMLAPGDVAVLSGLSDTLGQCDISGQLARLEQAKKQLQLQLDGARERSMTHAKLYRTMGMLSGAFLVILFI